MLQTYHNDEALKAKTIAAMREDVAAERLVPGHYWNGRNGCFVGCVIRGNDHSKFEDVLGIPRLIARLGNGIFEGLQDRAAQQAFAFDFLDAIPVGVYLSSCWPKFAVFMLADKEHGVLQYAKKDSTKKAIQDVVDLYQRVINGEKIDNAEWQNAYSAAADAAAYSADADAAAYAAAAYSAAADAAAYSAAADAAAYAAADAAAYSADAAYSAAADAAAYAAAAYSAADAADASSRARKSRFAAFATYLLKLFREATVN
jgi:hypothetical protein